MNFPRRNKQEPKSEPLPSYPLITINIPDSEKQPDETMVYKPRITVYHWSASPESTFCTAWSIVSDNKLKRTEVIFPLLKIAGPNQDNN